MITTELMQQLTRWSQGSQRVVLGIVGLPGAGKSTLTSWLQQQFGDAVALFPMDAFHLSNLQLRRLARLERKGAADTFDVEGYIANLQRIKSAFSQSTVYLPAFHREIEESIAAEIAIRPEVKLVITEGNYLLLQQYGWGAVQKLLDECWFIEVNEQQRLQQLLQRHMKFGRTEQEAEVWIAQTDAPNAELIAKTANLAQRRIAIPFVSSTQGATNKGLLSHEQS